MAKPKLSPGKFLQRLQMIEALASRWRASSRSYLLGGDGPGGL